MALAAISRSTTPQCPSEVATTSGVRPSCHARLIKRDRGGMASTEQCNKCSWAKLLPVPTEPFARTRHLRKPAVCVRALYPAMSRGVVQGAARHRSAAGSARRSTQQATRRVPLGALNWRGDSRWTLGRYEIKPLCATSSGFASAPAIAQYAHAICCHARHRQQYAAISMKIPAKNIRYRDEACSERKLRLLSSVSG
jgi:hypothetical protein